MKKLPLVLLPSSRPQNIAEHAQWLAGEGAGSWFVINKIKSRTYHICRYSPEGILECEGSFNCKDDNINLDQKHTITYPSHCAKVTVEQDKINYTFSRI